MAEDAANALAGDNRLRIMAILGIDDPDAITMPMLSEHFGDSSQWTNNLFELTYKSGGDVMFRGHPLIDGKMAYSHEGLKKWVNENQWAKDAIASVKSKDLPHSPYKDTMPDFSFNDGDNTVDMLWSRDHSNRNPTVRSRLIYAAQLWQYSTQTIDAEKLYEKIANYKMSPEQEEQYNTLSSSTPRRSGESYKTEDGWLVQGSAGDTYKVQNGARYPGEVGSDGVFRLSSDGSLVAEFNNGFFKYEGLIDYADKTVQLGDGTVASFPAATLLDSDNVSITKTEGGYMTGPIDNARGSFWNGKIAVRPDVGGIVFGGHENGLDVDEHGVYRIPTNKSLEYVVSSPIVEISKNGEKVTSGYASLGLAEGIPGYDKTIVDEAGLPSEFNGNSITDKAIAFKNQAGELKYIHKGKIKTAGVDFNMDNDGRVTYKGNYVNDPTILLDTEAANGFYTDGGFMGEVPFFKQDGEYDMHIRNGDWTFSPEFGWYFRSPDNPNYYWMQHDANSGEGSWMYSDQDSFADDGSQFWYDYSTEKWTMPSGSGADPSWVDATTGQAHSFNTETQDASNAPTNTPPESLPTESAPPEPTEDKTDLTTGQPGESGESGESGEASYTPIDFSDAILQEDEQGNYKLIKAKFTGEALRGQDALAAAQKDTNDLVRLHATTYKGPNKGQAFIENAIDKLIGPDNNPLRWLRKFAGAEDQVDLAESYANASKAATMDSVKKQNLATFVGEGRIAGKPPLFVDGTIEQQAAPFLQRKYIVDPDTGVTYENPDYDPALSDYIYTAGPDGTLGTPDDVEQMWSSSWLLPWEFRQQEAELRTQYGNALKEGTDYYYKSTFDSDGDGVADQSQFDRMQNKSQTQLQNMGIYGDPNKVYRKTTQDGELKFVTGDGVEVLDASGNRFEPDPTKANYGLDQSLSYTGEEYKAPLVNELADEAYAFQYGGMDDTRSKERRNSDMLAAQKYYRQLGDQLETLDYADKQKRNALLYNTIADTSPIAKARTDAFNNTAKAKLFGGQGITPGTFTTPTPETGKDFFGNKVLDVNNPYEVRIGKNKIDLLNKDILGKTPEETVTLKGGTNPVKPTNNIFFPSS
tara:strand:- start:4069 stop:7338 length:3270 start_codon:yes stop_codon:yes gene_type:complete